MSPSFNFNTLYFTNQIIVEPCLFGSAEESPDFGPEENEFNREVRFYIHF